MDLLKRTAKWLGDNEIFQRERKSNEQRALGMLLYNAGLMKAARTPCALWRRDELPPDRPTSTNSREAPEVKKELWDGEFWTDVITLP